MMALKRITLFTVLFLIFTSAVYSQSARQLNNKGFRMYKQKKYGDALALFEKAVKQNPNYALSHYNLACTLGVLRKKREICQWNAYKSTIIHHLKKSVELDPKRRERMKNDSDLTPVHDTYGYQILSGLNPDNENDLKTILQKVSWFGPGMGVHGPVNRIIFKNDEIIVIHYKDIDDDFKWKKFSLRYKVKETEISVIVIVKNGFKYVNGNFVNGVLVFEKGIPKLINGKFTDDPQECDA